MALFRVKETSLCHQRRRCGPPCDRDNGCPDPDLRSAPSRQKFIKLRSLHLATSNGCSGRSTALAIKKSPHNDGSSKHLPQPHNRIAPHHPTRLFDLTRHFRTKLIWENRRPRWRWLTLRRNSSSPSSIIWSASGTNRCAVVMHAWQPCIASEVRRASGVSSLQVAARQACVPSVGVGLTR